jgi:hypothetical protein
MAFLAEVPQPFNNSNAADIVCDPDVVLKGKRKPLESTALLSELPAAVGFALAPLAVIVKVPLMVQFP